MLNPCVLFCSSCEVNSTSVIEKFLSEDLSDGFEIESDLIAYPWHIDNKYYTADVNLIALQNKALLENNIASLVDAVVLFFDSSVASGLESAEAYLPFVEAYESDVKILVCDNCQKEGGGILKLAAQEWCISRGFELVELNPTDVIDPEDDFPETTGIERIRQALQAHEWSNLTLKVEKTSETLNPQPCGRINSDLSEAIGGFLEDDTFGELLSQLSDIQSQVSQLSGEARKDAAEKVVRAFWESMGGEPDDFEEL